MAIIYNYSLKEDGITIAFEPFDADTLISNSIKRLPTTLRIGIAQKHRKDRFEYRIGREVARRELKDVVINPLCCTLITFTDGTISLEVGEIDISHIFRFKRSKSGKLYMTSYYLGCSPVTDY